jgi:antitoxin VapB
MMMTTAKLFQNGQSQAVRLPKAFRLPGKEVYIKKVGNAIVLIPMDHPWETLFESLSQFSDDFMHGPEQPDMQTQEDAVSRIEKQ